MIRFKYLSVTVSIAHSLGTCSVYDSVGMLVLHPLDHLQPPLGTGVKVGKKVGTGVGAWRQVPFQEVYPGGSHTLSAQPQDAAES